MWLVATVLDRMEPVESLQACEQTGPPSACRQLRGPSGGPKGAQRMRKLRRVLRVPKEPKAVANDCHASHAVYVNSFHPPRALDVGLSTIIAMAQSE